MKLLFVAPQVPWPLDTGGKIRTFYLLRELCRRHEVTLAALQVGGRRAGELGPIPDLVHQMELVAHPNHRLRRGLDVGLGLLTPTPVSIRRYRVPALADRIRRIADRWGMAAVHFDSLQMADYRTAAADVPAVLDEHNVEATIWARLAETERGPRGWAIAQQARKMRAYEQRAIGAVARVLCCSTVDQGQLEDLHPGSHYRVVPNGVEPSDFDGVEPLKLDGTPMVFVGSMDWFPNVDGVIWFVREVLPAIRARVPDATFYVVGRNPPPEVQALRREPGVVVTGGVPAVAPYVAGARVAPVPLRSGSGTRLKILEAFAARRPVVSTRVGAEGIEAVDGQDLLLADEPAELADAVVRVIEDDDLNRRLGEAGRVLAESRYSWRAIGEQVAAIYEEGFALTT